MELPEQHDARVINRIDWRKLRRSPPGKPASATRTETRENNSSWLQLLVQRRRSLEYLQENCLIRELSESVQGHARISRGWRQ